MVGPEITAVSAEVPGSRHEVKNRNRRKFQPTKSQRRKELDSLRRKYTTVSIEPGLEQVLLRPSDPEFAFPIAILDFDLHVPMHYPHNNESPRIKVNNADLPRGYALNVELGFLAFAGTLVERVEKLDQHLEALLRKEPQKTVTIVPQRRKQYLGKAAQNTDLASKDDKDKYEHDGMGDKGTAASSWSSDDNSDSDSDSSLSVAEDVGDDDVEPGMESMPQRPAARGTEIVFPDIQLENFAVAEILSLNILFRCGRCKHLHEFHNLISAEYGHDSKPRSEACEKCGLPLMVAFRKEFLHSHSLTAGYLDISGGAAVDMLPSTFGGMCGECGSSINPPLKAVEFGILRKHTCRNCHKHISMMVELYRFDILSTDTIGASAKCQLSAATKPPKVEKLSLTGGQPLPNDGACEHYRKSLRWFRFACCKRVFPCDRCHDAELNHPADVASRMVCGKCSREQRFASACRYCRHDFTMRRSGFWEGGKGTRDRALLSRNDKRKYKGTNRENKEKNKAHFMGKTHEIKNS